MNAERALAAAEEYVTPIAVVDEAAMLSNIARMQRLAQAAGARLRPHAKTHKSARVAQAQLAAGAIGLTVATLHEAEYFAANGVEDLLLVHPPVGAPKRRRLAALAERAPRLAVAVDSLDAAEGLPPSVEILWEVDCGGRRVGTLPGIPTVEAVRRLVSTVGSARFRGLLTHAGQSYRAQDEEDRRRIAAEEVGALVETAAQLRAEGIPVREISVGSTPTAAFAPAIGGMTELRPGTYVYGDAMQVALGSHRLEDCALAVVATVVSIPAPDRIIVDAGTKAISADSRVDKYGGFGIVLGHPDWAIERMNEEHGIVVSSQPSAVSSQLSDVGVGDRLVIIPSHACTTVNLHGDLLFVAEDSSASWVHIEPRGWQGQALH